MARDSVAEIYSPGESRRKAIRVIGEAGEEAADASDGDAERERDCVEIAGRGAKTDVALDEFDGDEAADQGADDGFAADQVLGIVEVVQGGAWIFEPKENFRTERGTGNGGGDRGPAKRRGDGISEAAAEEKIDAEGDHVGESFEEEVGMDGVGAEVEIEREREMGRGGDAEL